MKRRELDLAFRALRYLKHADQPRHAEQVARALDVGIATAYAVLATLVRSKSVSAWTGMHGGYRYLPKSKARIYDLLIQYHKSFLWDPPTDLAQFNDQINAAYRKIFSEPINTFLERTKYESIGNN